MNYTTKRHKTLTLIRSTYYITKRRGGSENFEFPAGKGVYLQILDEDFRALKAQRSFTGVIPGKTRGCVGCHEQQNTHRSQADSHCAKHKAYYFTMSCNEQPIPQCRTSHQSRTFPTKNQTETKSNKIIKG